MSEKNSNKERPEVYVLRQDGTDWQISRRDFLKTAGIGAAVVGVGLNSRLVKPAFADDLDSLCKSALAHADPIADLRLSADGKHLLSFDKGYVLKCWDFGSQALLGNEKFDGGLIDGTGFLNDRSVAFKTKNETIQLISVPELKEISGKSIKLSLTGSDYVKALDVDSDGNVYIVSDTKLFRCKRSGESYDTPEVLTEASGGNPFWGVKVLVKDRSLFVLKDSGYGIFDIQKKSMTEYSKDNSFYAYAVMPGGSKALLCKKDGSEYRLVSLVNGSALWKKDLDQNIMGAAITPDGSYGIMTGTNKGIVLISMTDGTEAGRLTAGESPKGLIAVARDGSQCAVAVGQSILFINLPEFSIIGCPIDLSDMKDDTKGIKVNVTDTVTGQTITQTLPCGAPIPAGAVCVCNCVAGEIPTCSCHGYTCSCVGTCSCNNHTTTTYSYHYWHPN